MPKLARGGTELMAGRINTLPPELLSNFQIIHSRVRELDPYRKKILVLHDLARDPEVTHLKNGGCHKYDKLVFVSHQQQQMYNAYLGVPFDVGVVLQNAVQPFPLKAKPEDKVRLIYFSTPHRGLSIAYDAFCRLYQIYGDKIEFNVYSSFDLYGWEERDAEYETLFRQLQSHPGINYSKSVSNEEIRKQLERSHILAYPSTWEETSCLVLIESMMAGLLCVHSSLGALPETSLGCTRMYPYTEIRYQHITRFTAELDDAIQTVLDGYGVSDERIQFINEFYSWDNRKIQWEDLLTSLL